MNHKGNRNSNKHITYYFKCKRSKNTDFKQRNSHDPHESPFCKGPTENLFCIYSDKLKRNIKIN